MTFAQLRQDPGFTTLWNQTMGQPDIARGLQAIREVLLTPPLTESYDMATNALQNKFTQGGLSILELIKTLGITDYQAPQPDRPLPYDHIRAKKAAEVAASAEAYALEQEAKKKDQTQ